MYEALPWTEREHFTMRNRQIERDRCKILMAPALALTPHVALFLIQAVQSRAIHMLFCKD